MSDQWAKGDAVRFHPVDPVDGAPTVAPHPVPRQHEEGGAGDEVVQVTEATVRAVDRSFVQLRLHTQYLGLRRLEARPRIVGVHGRLLFIAVMSLLGCWTPLFATWAALPPSDYYGSSVPPGCHQPAADLFATALVMCGGRS